MLFVLLLTVLLVNCQVSRRWNEVISGNNHLWKQICMQHGFMTTKRTHTSAAQSNVTFSEPCADCCVKPPSNYCSQLTADSTNLPHPNADSLGTEDFPAAGDNECSEGYLPSVCYKKMFLSHKRIFDNFTSGQLLTTSIISGHSNRVTAIDYHNGYVATGKQQCTTFFILNSYWY